MSCDFLGKAPCILFGSGVRKESSGVRVRQTRAVITFDVIIDLEIYFEKCLKNLENSRKKEGKGGRERVWKV